MAIFFVARQSWLTRIKTVENGRVCFPGWLNFLLFRNTSPKYLNVGFFSKKAGGQCPPYKLIPARAGSRDLEIAPTGQESGAHPTIVRISWRIGRGNLGSLSQSLSARLIAPYKLHVQTGSKSFTVTQIRMHFSRDLRSTVLAERLQALADLAQY